MRLEHSSMVVIIHSNTSMKCKNRTTCRKTSAFVPVIAFVKLLSTLVLGADASDSAALLSICTAALVSSQRSSYIITLDANIKCVNLTYNLEIHLMFSFNCNCILWSYKMLYFVSNKGKYPLIYSDFVHNLWCATLGCTIIALLLLLLLHNAALP